MHRVVSHQTAPEPPRSEVTGSWKGHDFLLELKRNLSQENFTQLMEALKTYKESDELLDFLAKATALLTPDPNTHRLLRGLSYRIFGWLLQVHGSWCSTVNLSRVVPDGLLVFFPSYPVMDKTLEFWRGNGLAGRIENIKPMFVEPRGKATFTEVIDGYYERVNEPNGRGGSFFAVCRGKASEGLDFANSYGRGVVITGLPFPPRMDPRVTLKMQYLDEMSRKREAGVKYLSGQEWYRQQASRAVNQAIGRVIRHREDYGAIFLCDQRFKGTDVRAQLPSWVRPHVKLYDSFGCVVRDAAQFFRVAQKLRPPSEKKPAPLPASSSLCGGASGSGGGGGTGGCRGGGGGSGAACSSQKAKMLDSHVPSLKRRRTEEAELGVGVARLCVQYEAELPTNQRRARGLLDALEHSDHTGHTQQDANTQERLEERPSNWTQASKRKIRLVQRPTAPKPPRSEVTGSWKGHDFLLELKRNLSQENFTQLMEALKTYKESDELLDFLPKPPLCSHTDPCHTPCVYPRSVLM
ncbi:regulator of telomere elongation helicase 1-like [Alosa alosa]|uniref:regulator of telomere elongation helicase 1-like n=1 Tax=Alosa alosa TaxID=278164 RepID=UPI0020152E45|nr:regulator of telomere elongation helicase 1-like [Alosa alosa]